MSIVRAAISTAAVLAAPLLLAAPVRADAATDFLTAMAEQGLNVGDTPEDVQLTLALAAEICQVMHHGFSPQEAARQVPYVLPHATPQQAAGFVEAAQATMCESIVGPLPRW